MPTPEEITDLRRRLSMISMEHLQQLSLEDMTALMVTLREVLDKAEAVRTGPGPDEEKWNQLTT